MTNISDSEKAYHRCMMNHKESIVKKIWFENQPNGI